jgi:ArsR family transcriptional regulator, lead/cadmium/zinc/bismuth-responsive transcriptional repressor
MKADRMKAKPAIGVRSRNSDVDKSITQHSKGTSAKANDSKPNDSGASDSGTKAARALAAPVKHEQPKRSSTKRPPAGAQEHHQSPGATGHDSIDDCDVRSVDAAKVAAAKSRALPTSETDRITELFRLIGEPTRIRLLYALVETGEMCVCDLAAVVDAPETSVSHALRLLRMAGVVRTRRDGRMIFYSLADAHVRLLLDITAEHLHHTPPA